ncbi:MAG: SCP2 sterol-binding domain-containing protein [Alphaproteobacteria bacterium]|nr:SCP2 sterol-binding domain-containing protein [Alphaproteobacteria bacterium]
MEQVELPLPAARVVMSLMPPPVLSRMVSALVHKMERRHPRMFKNLERLDKATVLFEPTDLPHKFILKIGSKPVSLELAAPDSEISGAIIRGDLKSLLDMLEGRVDGDTLFFSRSIVVSGDTSVIVGLRNTLDREGLNLMDEVAAVCGPFAGSAIMAVTVFDKIAKRAKNHLMKIHDSLHENKRCGCE